MRGTTVWMPLRALTGAAGGRQGHRPIQRRRRSLPQGLSVYTGPCDSSSAATWLSITLGTVMWGFFFFFQKDLRFLWLPKDTKSERHSLAWSSLGKRSGLDYTSLLATTWRVFSLDNNVFFFKESLRCIARAFLQEYETALMFPIKRRTKIRLYNFSH